MTPTGIISLATRLIAMAFLFLAIYTLPKAVGSTYRLFAARDALLLSEHSTPPISVPQAYFKQFALTGIGGLTQFLWYLLLSYLILRFSDKITRVYAKGLESKTDQKLGL